MFSTPQSLQKRTGKKDLDRPTYLQKLADEYKCESTSQEKKEQVLANLANFAYDPINYEYFRRFDIINIFVHNLTNNLNNDTIKIPDGEKKDLSYSIAAICNLCLDPLNKEILVKQNISRLIIHYLLITKFDLNVNLETILNAITVLIFMFDSTKLDILYNKNLCSLMDEFSKSSNKRLSNLASLFLTDYLNIQTNSDSVQSVQSI